MQTALARGYGALVHVRTYIYYNVLCNIHVARLVIKDLHHPHLPGVHPGKSVNGWLEYQWGYRGVCGEV